MRHCDGIIIPSCRPKHQPNLSLPAPAIDSLHDAFEMYHEDPILNTTEITPWYYDRDYVNDNASLVSVTMQVALYNCFIVYTTNLSVDWS